MDNEEVNLLITPEQTSLPRLPETKTAYEYFQDSEGIPRYGGAYVEDLNSLKLGYWKRKGVLGAFVNLDGQEGIDDAYVLEIPPKGKTNPEQHMFEETIFILSGRGTTTITGADGEQHFFEWGKGSLFAVPLNSVHQHFNSDGSNAARYVAVTDTPLVHNLFHNVDFLFHNPFQFTDRTNLGAETWNGSGKFIARKTWETNFVPDLSKFELQYSSHRGSGNSNMLFELAENTMTAHMSEFAVGTYKKAHRHGPGAHIVVLSGRGYSLLWKEGEEEKRRYDWKPGTMISPGSMVYHQHFNTSNEPARYLALRYGSRKHLMGAGFVAGQLNEDRDQIEYEDEDTEVRKMFEEELSKNGVESKMPPR